MHALHDHHLGVAIVPEHLGDHHQVEPLHVAAQLRGIGGLAHQIQFVVQVLVELRHTLPRLESLAIGRQFFNPARHHAHQVQVLFDGAQHVGPQHFDGHFPSGVATVSQSRKVDLGDRSTGDRDAIKLAEYRIQRFAKRTLDGGHSDFAGKRRHPVLQMGQLVGDIRRQQVPPRRQHLAKLDEDGPELLQRLTQALTSRCIEAPPQGDHAPQALDPRAIKPRENQLVEAVTQHDPDDERASKQAVHAPDPC